MTFRLVTCLGLLLAVLAPSLRAEPAAAGSAQNAFFEAKIRPLLANNCFKCHGEKKQESGLRLDSRAGVLAGGETGPAVAPGKPDESLMVRAVRYQDLEMPPTGKLKEHEVASLIEWIKMGAPWPSSGGDAGPVVRKGEQQITEEDRRWWSFQPVWAVALPGPVAEVARLRDPVAPARSLATSATWIAGPIDAFIVERLQSASLAPNPPATRRELIRRAAFDLVGLPPSMDEVRKFESDPAPDAFERVVDRLLASPRYGERWGRHWLDLVRFAQTNGYERDDEKPLAWRYRDYVIRALNRDKPYDQFVREQLAGDELTPVTDDSISATAFYRLGVWDDEPDDKRMAEFEELDDIVSTTGATFLGLSIGCARCHDHKFDPISQEDYYSTLAFVRNISLYGNDKSQTHSQPNREGIFAALPSGAGNTLAVRQRMKMAPTNVLPRGNAATPGKSVQPRYLRVLSPAAGDASHVRLRRPPEPELPPTFGLRRALADWIVSPTNPLTSRVIVNRLWHYHFGRGIVPTPSDFGRTGQKPSHPELLDHLASELVRGGWELKRMHLRIMSSGTYRQSSSVTSQPSGQNRDPDNVLLWRQNLRRLEAEAIRDAILSASGQLNLAMGGRGVFPTLPPEVLATQSRPGLGWDNEAPPAQQSRRSVYVFVKRTLGVPFLETFDVASPDKSIPARATTTIAPQALILLNSALIDEQAAAMAQRLAREVGKNPRARIERAFEIAINRAPTDDEIAVAEAFLARSGPSAQSPELRDEDAATWASFCKLVLNLNEFVYVD
jgi:hypothetical protein